MENRLLEEWKANNDLFKYHEDLKQKRFAYFLTIQTGFLALFGLLSRDALSDIAPLKMLVLIVMTIPPIYIALFFGRIDARARAYVDTVKGKLLLLEKEWRLHFPKNHFATYEQQFDILVHRRPEVIQTYLAAREIEMDPFSKLITARAAHVGEETIIRLFIWLWLSILVFSSIGFIWGFSWRYICST